MPAMTESDARKKVCCQASREGELCAASDCMGWRWLHSLSVGSRGANTGGQHSKKEEGYCGLAGRP